MLRVVYYGGFVFEDTDDVFHNDVCRIESVDDVESMNYFITDRRVFGPISNWLQGEMHLDNLYLTVVQKIHLKV